MTRPKEGVPKTGMRRRWVEASRLLRKGDRAWAYGYRDLARLFGVTASAVKAAVLRGTLDPGDLVSVVKYLAKQDQRRVPIVVVRVRGAA